MICNNEFNSNCNSSDIDLSKITLIFKLRPYVEDMKDYQLVINDFSQFSPRSTVNETESLKPTTNEDTINDTVEEIKQKEIDIKEESNNLETNLQRCASVSKLISQTSSHNKNGNRANEMFECAQCGYKTASKPTLKSHIKIHSRVKPFICNICEYRTVDKSNLRAHVRIHAGERPHQCTFCSYKTTSRFVLKQHVTIHTGEKLFKCELCDFRTGYRRSIAVHMSTHTGIKPFRCTECSFRSVTKRDLIKHLRVHTGEKPFACSKCEYRASTKSCLHRHERNRHMH